MYVISGWQSSNVQEGCLLECVQRDLCEYSRQTQIAALLQIMQFSRKRDERLLHDLLVHPERSELDGNVEKVVAHTFIDLEQPVMLAYVPQYFQDPSQLLLLKHVQFYKLHTEYCSMLDQLVLLASESQINSHTAIVALSAECPFTFTDRNFTVLSCSILSALFGATSELKDCKMVLLDKLDIIECLNPSMVKWRTEVIHSGIDPDECDRETTLFELSFTSLLENTGSISLFHTMALAEGLFQSLIYVCKNSPTHFSEVCRVILQHIYWIDSSYLEAFLNVSSAKVLPAATTKGDAKTFQLAEMTVRYVYIRPLDILAVLRWYLTQLIEHILVQVAEEWRENLQQTLRQLTATEITIHSGKICQ